MSDIILGDARLAVAAVDSAAELWIGRMTRQKIYILIKFGRLAVKPIKIKIFINICILYIINIFILLFIFFKVIFPANWPVP